MEKKHAISLFRIPREQPHPHYQRAVLLHLRRQKKITKQQYEACLQALTKRAEIPLERQFFDKE